MTPQTSRPAPKTVTASASDKDLTLGKLVACTSAPLAVHGVVCAAKALVDAKKTGYAMVRYTYQGYVLRARAKSAGTIQLEITHPSLNESVFRALSEVEVNKITSPQPVMATCKAIAATALPADPKRLREIRTGFDSSGTLRIDDDALNNMENQEDDEGIDFSSGKKVRFSRERD